MKVIEATVQILENPLVIQVNFAAFTCPIYEYN